MSDYSLLLEVFLEIEEAIRRIERRFSRINQPSDFTSSDEGIDRLDGIGMMLISISENVRRLEKIMGVNYLMAYPDIPWESVKGIRNILAHDYFNIDAEEIYAICSTELLELKVILQKMRRDINK